MIKKVAVKWILRLKQKQIEQQIGSIEQFWEKCHHYKDEIAHLSCEYVQKQTIDICSIAFIKQGKAYLPLVGNNILTQTFNGTRERAHYSSVDLSIQLFAWPQLERQIERQAKIQQINKNIFKVNQEFQKLSKCMGQGYYNNLRMYYKKLENQKNDILNIKVFLLISQPLVKNNQNSQKNFQVSEEYNDHYIGIPKQQIKINQHIQAIKDAHEGKNYGVNLFIERVFVSWSKIKALVERIKHPKREEEKNIHLNIIQIYTELYEENSKLFVSLEDDKVIGLEDKSVTLNSLIAKLNEIGDKLYCIVLVGPKMRRLGLLRREKSQTPVEKQWYKQTNKPIVVVSVFDPEKDNLLKKYFLPEFYANLFKRYSVNQCLKRMKQSINPSKEGKINYKAESDKLLQFCCCLHEHDSKYNWNKIISRIGRCTAHKIFRHSIGEDYSKTFMKKQRHQKKYKNGECPHEDTRRQIYKYIMGESPKQLDQPDCIFMCYEQEKQNQLRVSLDLLIFNEQKLVNDIEESRKNKIFWEAGEFKEENIIKAKKYQRQRLITLFQIVNQIQKVLSFTVLIITGYPKSGKSLFIELAISYVMNRCDDYQLQQFENWHKLFQNDEITKIKEKILKMKKKQKTMILLFSKIKYDRKYDFELLMRKLSQMPEIQNQSILVIGSMGDNQQISKNSVIKLYKIKQIEHSLVKYLILKHQLTNFSKKKDVEIYIDFMSKLKSQNNFQIYFSYLFNDLNLIKNDENKRLEIQKKYMNKTYIILDSIRSDNELLWQTIGFICSFYSDFFLCEFNKKLFIQNKEILSQVIRKKQIRGSNDSKVRLFRINFFENSQQNYKLQNSYLIHSESKCFEYFKKHSSYFFPRKCRYFLQFYHLFFIFLKRNSGTKLTEHCQRIIDELGIFIFDFDQKFKEMETENNRMSQLRENPEKQLKKMTPEQRSYLLERNLYLLIQFLKEVNDKDGKELKKMEKELVEVSRIILLVSICRKSEDELVCCLKDELNCEIVRFLEANQFLIQSQYKDEVIILFYQISALVGYQLKIKVQADSIVRMLDNLLAYEMSKIEIERAKRLIEQNRNCRDQQVEKIVYEIKRAEDAIKTNLEEGNLSDLQFQNHHECLLDLLVEKVVLFHSTEGNNFEPKSLKGQFDELIQRVSEKTRNAPTIKICEAYLKVKLNIHSNKDLDENNLSKCYFPRKVVELYQFVRKINPKTLFQNNNITLFIDIDSIIKKFLEYTISSRSLNIFCLTSENFTMVSQLSPQIYYLVLSVDYFTKQMIKEEFINLIKKIKFKFLILFGSKSTELASEIEAKLQEHKKERAFVIISLTLNKRNDIPNQTPDVANIVDSFKKVENGQRAMQMTICCIIYLLAKDRHSKEVTKQQISQIVEKSIKISYRVVDEQLKNISKVIFRIYFREDLRLQFVELSQGKMRNLSASFPKSFLDMKDHLDLKNLIQQLIKQKEQKNERKVNFFFPF